MLQGIDVSYVQKIIDFAALKASGQVHFVYGRATYGANPAYDDGPIFVRDHDVARQRDIPFGAYHFYRFRDDAGAQARHFLHATAGRIGTLLPMVDIEEGSFEGIPDLQEAIASIASVLHAIEAEIGRHAIIYTNYDTWTRFLRNTDAFCGRPLWVAQSLDPRTSGLFGGWKRCTLWQQGTIAVPGINGAVDRDWLLGTLEEISR